MTGQHEARGFAPRPRKLPRHGSDLGEAGEKQTGQDRQTDQGLRVQGGYDTSPTAVTPRAVVSGVTRPNTPSPEAGQARDSTRSQRKEKGGEEREKSDERRDAALWSGRPRVVPR